MSVSIDLRNFKNPADKNRKLKDYMEYLKLQQKLNTQADIAFKALAKGQSMGIAPQPAMKKYASAEEAQADIAEQRTTALGYLRQLFPYGDDATRALGLLDPYAPIGTRGSELYVFNQSWQDFNNEIKGQKDITVPYFETLWNRYKLKLTKTRNTGIQIPIDDTEFNTQMRNLGTQTLVEMNRLYNLSQRTQMNLFRMTATKQEEVREAIQQAIQNRDQTKLEQLNKALKEGNERIVNKLITEIRPIRLLAEGDTGEMPQEVELEKIRLMEAIDKQKVKIDRAKRNLEQSNLSKYQQGRRERVLNDEVSKLEALQDELDNLNEEFPEGMKRSRKSSLEPPESPPTVRIKLPKKKPTSPTSEEDTGGGKEEAKEEGKVYKTENYEYVRQPRMDDADIRALTKGKKLSAGDEFSRTDLNGIAISLGIRKVKYTGGNKTNKGKFFRVDSKGNVTKPDIFNAIVDLEPRFLSLFGGTGLKKKKKRGVIVGKGIQKSSADRYQQFGKYIIHIPSLKKSILNLKFKSGGYIPNIPSTHVSEEFREMIQEILETERLPVQLFNKLSKQEQKLFERVAQMAGIDDTLGLKVDNTEKKEALKRYEILRGELLAGNDNEEIRKELKTYILRFMNENLIPRKEGTSVLMELMAMG